ncbi:Por secretion system C-terminal sorting domain-containing protein [Chryseobacterium arachidis]|uniref:Por secretion system C-terminal sorting domain-containing protein n=1 Tax=Chryseobacterium arachidis TaxID=1416778 RepID=A0A1M4ZKV1_9FLAO|nr:fibronectin type III domain-containing protein [Chryseobacterium arachidis]SHF18575.1 Por secretion system C-terminal sorting domain-containing protein [Chryseobacterium arachidis]
MKKISTFLVLLLCLLNWGALSVVYGQTPLPYSQNFNTANDFTFVNGTLTNKWVYGSATGNTGSSIYISNNGTANTYTTNSGSIVHAYKDFTIPAGSTISNFSFDWKGAGESGWDFLKVWLVPATFTPTANNNITAGGGRIQVAGDFNQQTTWQTYSTPTLNISTFAGNTMRLVFEWTNDTSAGTQPPIAVDNINISIPTCIMPSAMSVSAIGTNTATLGWTAPTPVPGVGYEYYLSTTNTAPTAATVGTANAGTTANPGGLATATTYYWWVRSVCSATDKSVWVAGPSFSTTQIPGTIPYTQNFSTGNDLQLANGTMTNKWAYGSATGNPANSLYISNNNGTSNAYTTGPSVSNYVHAFRDLIVPAGTTEATLQFDWKGVGESGWDFLKVWLVPITYTPTAGTQITAGGGRIQVGGNLNQQSAWQNYFNPLVDLSTFATSGFVRLVFEWTNDTSGGTQPPAAIDNINLSIPTCKVPQNIQVVSVGSNTASISWTAPNPAPVGGYQIYWSTTNVAPTAATVPNSTSTATTATLSPLTPNTTYYFWVRSKCAGTDASFWMVGPSFTTGQIPATIPYIQQFNTGSDLGYTNGTQTNKWVYGSATGNTGNSLYISNTNGTTNAYSTSSTSIVHAYRDILIPAGTTTATFSFDWKAAGESSWDYLRVWLVPSTFMPTSGVNIGAGTGRIQVGGNYNQQTTWQTVLNPTQNLSSFAGQTMRLVFEWTNDSSGGTQPPVAIDNINIRICSTATPVVTVGTPTYNSVVLTWPQDNGGASYIVNYRPQGSGAPWQSVTVAAVPYPQPTNTTTLTGLLSATLYEVQIVAVCNGNQGTPSQNTFTTRCDPTPPGVTVTNITTTSALITWSPVALGSHYYIRYRLTGSGNAGWSAPIPVPVGSGNSYLLQGLNVYTSYDVQVANMCDTDNTLNPWSNPKVFVTARTCDIAPPGLTITSITPTTAVVTWDPFPGATYILRYRKIGVPSWTPVTSNTNSITLTGLLELTQYEMQVANICSGTPGNYTLPYLFTTPTIVYCQMASTGSTSEYISKVTVTPNGKPEKQNASLASNYTDYTGDQTKFIEMIQGSSNNKITIDKKLTGNTNAGVAVWIDFNRNGYFDIDERILVAGPSNEQTVSGTFTVPADAFISMTDFKYVVMRVALQKDGIPVTCNSFATGEVEDYTVRISKPIIANPINQTEILIYPNPVTTVLNVKNVSKRANYKIYNATGQIVSSGIILNNKIDVHALINGVYVIDIDDVQGTAQKKFIKE